MSDPLDLAPPWSRLATVHDDTDLFPQPTMDALSATYATRSHGALTIAFGDSIDAGSDLGSHYSDGSVYNALTIVSGQRVKWYRNAGVSGETTAQMLARIQADVIAYKPGIVITGGATNDLGQGVPTATTRANIVAIVDTLRAAGISVVLRTSPPCNVDGAGRRSATEKHNAWIAGFADARGIPLLDYYGPVVDETTGAFAAAYTSDGVHPNAAGQRRIADAAVATLPAVFTGKPNLVTSLVDSTDMLTGRGLFLGTPSGGLAGGWGTYGNDSVPSVEADAAIPGNWQKITGGTSSIRVIDTSITTGFAPGDIVELSARIEKAGVAGSKIRVQFFNSGGSGSGAGIDVCGGTRDVDGISVGRGPVPAATTSVTVEMIIEAGETFRVAQATLRNLTALGIATRS
jgi:lysophospholipase L1-like esterase